jgi:hypothetical protein
VVFATNFVMCLKILSLENMEKRTFTMKRIVPIQNKIHFERKNTAQTASVGWERNLLYKQTEGRKE